MPGPERLRKSELLALLGLITLLLLLIASRQPAWGDSYLDWKAAHSLVHRGTLGLPAALWDNGIQAPDGQFYVKYPLLQTLCVVPAVFLFELAQRPLGLMTMSLPCALIGALGVVGMVLTARELGVPRRMALVGAPLLFWGSPWCVYARYYYGENLQMTLATWLIWAWLNARRRGASGWLLSVGALAGLTLNAKILFVLWLPILGLDLLFRKSDAPRRAALLGAGLLPGLLLLLGYNQLRYGTPWSLGYSLQRDAQLGFGTPLPVGAFGLLLSSGKSVFLYAPALLLLPFAVRRAWQQRREETLVAAALVLPYFALVACWWSWSGDWNWGPRLLCPLLPLTLLWVLAHVASWRKFLVLSVLGVGINMLGWLILPVHYLQVVFGYFVPLWGSEGDWVLDNLMVVHFVPEFSPLLGHAWLVGIALGIASVARPPWSFQNVPHWRPPDAMPVELDLWWTSGAGTTLPLLGLLLAAAVLAVIFVSRLNGNAGAHESGSAALQPAAPPPSRADAPAGALNPSGDPPEPG